MNIYLLALVGMVVVCLAQEVMNRVFYRSQVTGMQYGLKTITLSIISSYLIALGFIHLFDSTIFSSGIIGMAKGLYLGGLIGLIGFVLPIIESARRVGLVSATTRALAVSWFVSMLLLGLAVGYLS